MENNDFDELMREAIAKRCSQCMPETVATRVRQKCRSRVRRNRIWSATVATAAAVVAVCVIVPGASDESTPVRQQSDAPSFIVEAEAQTRQRLENASLISEQLRNNIDNQYTNTRQ